VKSVRKDRVGTTTVTKTATNCKGAEDEKEEEEKEEEEKAL